MSIGVFSGAESAAGKAVGTDLLADVNEPWRMASDKRILVSVAIVGGNAVAEAILDLKIGDKTVATLRNSQSGASVFPNRDDEVLIGRFVPSGSQVQLVVRKVGSVNVLVYQFRFKGWKTLSRRTYTARRTYVPYRRTR